MVLIACICEIEYMQNKFLLLSILFVSCALAAIGQDFEETGLAEDAKVIRQSNVRQRPTVKSPKLDTLLPDAAVRIIEDERINGYFRVLFGNGQQGYVYYKNVELPENFFKAAKTVNLAASERTEEPCISTGFETCPPRGCYAPGSNGALFNEAKRRMPTGITPVTISFADLLNMQNEIGNRLGIRSQNKTLTAAERAQLSNISVTNGIVGESTLVKIVGYIPAGKGLKEGSIETVNCKFADDSQKDIHIPLTPLSTSTEYQGIVIEMIPQNHPLGWNLAKLKRVRAANRKVMVIGGLFYDNEHLVNTNPAKPLTGHSKRFSIWEIHPVTQFFVCSRVNNSCTKTSMNGWIPLESFP